MKKSYKLIILFLLIIFFLGAFIIIKYYENIFFNPLIANMIIIFIDIIIIINLLILFSNHDKITNPKIKETKKCNFFSNILIGHNDEIADLENSFVKMADKLIYENLELEKKICELEKFTKFTVNRELKIIELKKILQEKNKKR